jgi:hypothetical protein
MQVDATAGCRTRARHPDASYAETCTQPLCERSSTVFFSVVPVVMQNCTHAVPALNIPFDPCSTRSMVNVAVWNALLHVIGLRWLSHQAAEERLDPSFMSLAAERPDFVCFADT